MNRAAILVFLLMAGPAFGHDIYKDWKAQSGASCCSERKEHPSGDVTGDCRPVRAVQDMNGSESCFMALSLLKVLRAGTLYHAGRSSPALQPERQLGRTPALRSLSIILLL